MVRAPARERLVKAADDLFYRDGITATGIDAITAHAGVAKKSLYNNFSSKADLLQSYMLGRRDDWQNLLQSRLAAAASPRERILAVFDSYIDHAANSYEIGFRGCSLLNAAAELPSGSIGRAIVLNQKAEVEGLFLTYLKQIHLSDVDVAEAASHLSFVLEGAMARAGLEGHDAQLRQARRIASTIVDRFDAPPQR